MKRINSLLGIDISVEIGPELLEFLIEKEVEVTPDMINAFNTDN